MQRTFHLREDGYLEMVTYLEDEFGELKLTTFASIEESFIQQTSSDLISMDMRIQEMQHFLKVLSLFNPLSNSDHGLSQIVSQTSPE